VLPKYPIKQTASSGADRTTRIKLPLKVRLVSEGGAFRSDICRNKLLHFTKAEIVRECNRGIENVAANITPPGNFSIGRSTQTRAEDIPNTHKGRLLRTYHYWYGIIQDYRSRNIHGRRMLCLLYQVLRGRLLVPLSVGDFVGSYGRG
jgi:hypothetical protein